MSEQLTACVITLNEADRIDACLESLAWCDEIVVVDSHSTDDTRARAVARGARVIERDWPGYAAQKEFAIRAAAHDWVLVVDADERLSEPLRAELIALRANGFPGAAAWSMPRCSQYLGRWIRHGTWYPDRTVRLFDRRRGRFAPSPDYDLHERVVLDGPSAALRGELLHIPYRDIGEHLRTIDRYTTIMAAGLHARGQRAGLSHLVLRPAGRFFKFFVLKRGFLDGWRGLLLAYLAAHYVRMRYAKLMALTLKDRS
ncbi:MAG: glycosyltransferase family 2 protein [Deltaproteobacteria bacterium]|nr:glycosyltransferase family 2 protein [Deltaproteobacteria bacterium]